MNRALNDHLLLFYYLSQDELNGMLETRELLFERPIWHHRGARQSSALITF